MNAKAVIRDSSFVIRESKHGDAFAILELEKQFTSDRMSMRTVRNFLTSPSAHVWVTFSTNHESRITNHEMVGCLILLTRKNSRITRIYSVVVSPAARGLGLGAQLVRHAEKWAVKNGGCWISLEVRQDNPVARSMYAGLGYHEHAQLPGYYDDGTPGLRLRKRLS